MNSASAIKTSRGWFGGYLEAWDRFWFTPRLPHTLAVLRVFTGLMLLYSHLVLATDLSSFLGDQAWVNNTMARQLHDGAYGPADYGRSYLWHLSNPLLLWAHHILTMVVTASFAAGLLTRFTAPAAWLLQLMYLHRMTGHLFGLDQIATYSLMYLMLAPSGSWLSVDAWLRQKWADRRSESRFLQWLLPDTGPSVAANIATRLFQLHVCVIYLFGGLSKARGETWWDGTAMWYAIGNYEYQSADMTWMANYPRLISALSHVTVFWEVFYCALIWPRLTRPFVLAAAVAVHGGIALFLGMITFGTMMIAANLIFVPPEWLLRRSRSSDGDRDEDSVSSDDHAIDDEEEETEHLEAFSLDELGLDEVDLDSHGSDILSRSADPDASPSGILDNIVAREAALARREERLRQASRTLGEKKQRLNQQLEKYNNRVARLKQRESKIKKLVDRRRKKKGSKGDS